MALSSFQKYVFQRLKVFLINMFVSCFFNSYTQAKRKSKIDKTHVLKLILGTPQLGAGTSWTLVFSVSYWINSCGAIFAVGNVATLHNK